MSVFLVKTLRMSVFLEKTLKIRGPLAPGAWGLLPQSPECAQPPMPNLVCAAG